MSIAGLLMVALAGFVASVLVWAQAIVADTSINSASSRNCFIWIKPPACLNGAAPGNLHQFFWSNDSQVSTERGSRLVIVRVSGRMKIAQAFKPGLTIKNKS